MRSENILENTEAASSRELPEFHADLIGQRRSDYCVIVPVINEGARIQAQLERMHELVDGIDVIVADGGSTDGSLELDFLRKTGVRAKLTKRGPGLLSAQLRMAYSWALDEGYEGIITIDGNGKDGVAAIGAFRDALASGADFIQGSRYVKGGEAINTPAIRWFAGRFIFAPVLSLAGGYWYSEITNGFRGYSRRFLMDHRVAPFRDVFSSYNLLFYLSVRAPQLGYTVIELPVTRSYPKAGRVPTKISGRSAQLAITGELVRTALGAFHPRHTGLLGDRFARIPPALSWGLCLAVMAIFTLLAVGTILNKGDPFVDEAMLAENYQVIGFGSVLTPLPLYDQAASVGYAVAALATLSVSDASTIVSLRVLGLVVTLVSALLVVLSLERLRSLSLAPAVLALVFLSPHVFKYSIAVKHYNFELLAFGLAIFGCALAVSRKDATGAVLLTGMLVLAVICSVPGTIIVMSAGMGVGLWLVSRSEVERAQLWRPFMLAIGLAVAFAIVWHVLVIVPIIEQQITAYPDAYGSARFQIWPPALDSVVDLGNLLLRIFWPFSRAAGDQERTLLLVFLAVGLIVSLRYQPLVPFLFASVVMAFLALSIIGVLPRLALRQLIFLAPISAIVLVVGSVSLVMLILGVSKPVQHALSVTRLRTLVYVLSSVAIIFLMSYVAQTAAQRFERQQLSPLISHIVERSDVTAPVFAVFTAQPGLATLPHDLSVIGRIDPSSVADGWARWVWAEPGEKVGRKVAFEWTQDYLDFVAESTAGLDRVWVLATHLRRGRYLLAPSPLLDVVEGSVGPCIEAATAKDSALFLCGGNP